VRRNSLAIVLVAALAQACSCDNVPQDAVTSCEQAPPVPTAVRTDILFVIDDSTSMNGEQYLLRDALAAFIDQLVASPVQLEFQVGVTTTSVEDFGGGESYGSGTPYPDGIVLAVDPAGIDLADFNTWGDFFWTNTPGAPDPGFYGPRILRWDSATLVDDFKTNVLVGTNGTGREQPLEAMRLALSTQIATGSENEGFLRPGARLAVVFITDEDDCSGPQDASITSSADCRAEKTASPSLLTPVSDYADFLNGTIGGELRDPVVAIIGGLAPGTLVPSCSGSWCSDKSCSTATDKADRFLSLLGGLPAERTLKASVCDATFGATLTSIACALVPQDVPLDSEPADWRMMAVALKAGSTTIPCAVTEAGSADEATADVVLHPASGGQPAYLHFQNACRLDCGLRIEISLICAG